jgi:hypothetical protein
MPDMPYQRTRDADHGQHHELLVSRYAMGDELDTSERTAGEALVTSCSQCRALADDLRTLAQAVAAEPIPPRPRDFRLTPSQAEHARGSRLQRLLDGLPLPDLALLRPLAGSAIALGFLLIAVGTVLPPSTTPVEESMLMVTTNASPTAGAFEAAAESAEADLERMRSEPSGGAASGAAASPAPGSATLSDTLSDDGSAGTSGGSAVISGGEQAKTGAQARESGDEVGAMTASSGPPESRGVSIALGVLIALAGVIVGWLAWLARRTEDPLYR